MTIVLVLLPVLRSFLTILESRVLFVGLLSTSCHDTGVESQLGNGTGDFPRPWNPDLPAGVFLIMVTKKENRFVNVAGLLRGGRKWERREDVQDASVPCCHRNQLPRVWWLQITQTHHLTVLGVRGQRHLFIQVSLN